MTEKNSKMIYYCPRCKTTKISEYENTFECTKCRDKEGLPLEFEKKSIGKIPDDEILALRETGVYINAFEELKDPENRARFLKSIEDDLD